MEYTLLNIDNTDDLKKRIKILAAKNGESMVVFVTRLLTEAVEKIEKEA